MAKSKSVAIGDSPLTTVLSSIYKCPERLFYRGQLPEKRPVCVAIVGSRKPTSYGREVSHRFAYDLTRAGVCVISGLADGVDTIVHKATLEAGGLTLAVLAHGLHNIYPSSNKLLAAEIIKSGGALISEYPDGEEARRYTFLNRNRIISGLADAVLITEAGERSGTLTTAKCGIEQNKDIFAVPGPINSVLSVGTNRLIQSGAHVALEARDILERIAPSKAIQQRLVPVAMNEEEDIIINLLNSGVKDGDILLARSKLSTNKFLETMTILEINGIIQPTGANNWTTR